MSGMGIYSGTLAREPELRQTKNGTPVCSNTIFVWTGKDDPKGALDPRGNVRKVDCPVNFTVYGKDAERLHADFHKGHTVHLQGYVDVNVYSPRDLPDKTVKQFELRVHEGGLVDENYARSMQKLMRDAVRGPEKDAAERGRESAARTARSQEAAKVGKPPEVAM